MSIEKSTQDVFAKALPFTTRAWRECLRLIFRGVNTMIGKRTWALAAILALCGMIFLPSCSDDNPSAKV